jgi:hypothetical protein
MIFNSSYSFLGDCTSGTATKGTTTNIDYKIEGSYMLFGAEMLYTGAVEGDYVALQIVDKDNVLGYGADVVVNEWVKKWYVPFNSTYWKVTSDMTTTIPAGLYARVKYTSVGSTNDVSIKLNYYMIWP